MLDDIKRKAVRKESTKKKKNLSRKILSAGGVQSFEICWLLRKIVSLLKIQNTFVAVSFYVQTFFECSNNLEV